MLYQLCLKITVMCSFNLTTLRSKMWKNMGWNPAGINSLSIDGSYVVLSPGDLVGTVHEQHWFLNLKWLSIWAKESNVESLGTLPEHYSRSAKQQIRLNESFPTVLSVTNDLYQTIIFLAEHSC